MMKLNMMRSIQILEYDRNLKNRYDKIHEKYRLVFGWGGILLFLALCVSGGIFSANISEYDSVNSEYYEHRIWSALETGLPFDDLSGAIISEISEFGPEGVRLRPDALLTRSANQQNFMRKYFVGTEGVLTPAELFIDTYERVKLSGAESLGLHTERASRGKIAYSGVAALIILLIFIMAIKGKPIRRYFERKARRNLRLCLKRNNSLAEVYSLLIQQEKDYNNHDDGSLEHWLESKNIAARWYEFFSTYAAFVNKANQLREPHRTDLPIRKLRRTPSYTQIDAALSGVNQGISTMDDHAF